MAPKKDPGKKPPGKEKKKEIDIFQDAQSQTISTEALEEILSKLRQQYEQQSQKLSTQTGSSTPSGPSVHKPQTRSSTSKKNLDSYVQAFAARKIPADQTWGQIVSKGTLVPSETKTKQEYDLLNLQAALELSKSLPTPEQTKQLTIASSSSKAIVSSPSKPKLDTPYFLKENQVSNIVQCEPEFFCSTPNQTALKFFPKDWYFKPTSFLKTREYYEFILAHSDSAIVQRYKSVEDKEVITHSTLQILQVLTPAQWGQSIWKIKLFGAHYDPEGYNYQDYVDAWSNVFWDQNKLFKHTWFIYFKKGTKYNFPQWFVNWWKFFGPVPEILPPTVQQALELFKQKFNNEGNILPIDLHYFSKLSVAWIISWHYRFSHKHEGTSLLPLLQRTISVRWWPNFDISRIDVKAVDRWFKANPRHLCQTETSKFLNQKSRVQAVLASTTDKAALIQQLGLMLNTLQQESQPSTSASQDVSASPSEKDEEEEPEYVVDLGDL